MNLIILPALPEKYDKKQKALYPKIQRRPCRVPLCFVPVLRQKPQRALVKASSAMTGGIRHSLLAHAFGVQLPKCISHARACCLTPPDSSLQVRYDRYFFSIIAFVYSVYVRDYSTVKTVCQGLICKKSDKNCSKKRRADWKPCARKVRSARRLLLNNPPWG